MSLSTEGFTLLGNLKVPSLGVGVTSSNTPLLIKAADLTTAMTSSLKADWGDLRLSSDEAGNTQLPLDIAATDYAWTRLTSVAADTLIYVWGNKPAATKEIDTATYGRNAVWSTSKRRYHFEENPATTDMVDSSGNAAGTRVGTFAAGDKVAGVNGSALKFTHVVNHLTSGTVIAQDTSKSISFCSTFQSVSALRGLVSIAGSAHGSSAQLIIASRSGNIDILDSGSWQRAITAPALDTDYKIDYVYDAAADTTTIYVDGNSAASYASGDGVYDPNQGNTLYINAGFIDDAAQTISEFEYTEYAKTADQISIEYQNQTASGAWWIAEDAGGGTPTLYPSFIPSAEEFYTASVENMLSVIEPSFIITQESIYNPEVSPQGVTILPDYIPSEESVYNPTVMDLLQVLSPEFIPTEETVYSPEVERLLRLLYPSYIESEETTYNPTVTGGDSISIPLTDRRTWNAVAQYLRDLVFTGQDNDVIQKWFISEGYEGEYNENWNSYLADQGYTDGNLSDRYSAWRKQ